MKLPALQFYPGDWRKDPGVQSLNYFDRGVWFEILCLMHESSDRGKLLLNGQPMPDDALATILGLDKQILTTTLNTLLTYGVASRDIETGALINRRMVKDETLRQIRTEAGKKGGNPVLLNQKPTKQAASAQPNGNHPAKQKSTPSSSSSSSVSSSEEEQSPHARLMALHASFIVGEIPNGGAQGKALKWLLERYSVDDLQRCYLSLRDQKWRNKVTWGTVQSEIGEWLARTPADPAKRNGDGPPSPPSGPLPTVNEDEFKELGIRG